VLSGRGLCDELITRPEESYRLWYVVLCDLETSCLVGCLWLFINYILHNGKGSLKARVSRSKDNIKSNFQEIAYEDLD
jgi:hypothetical protein